MTIDPQLFPYLLAGLGLISGLLIGALGLYGWHRAVMRGVHDAHREALDQARQAQQSAELDNARQQTLLDEAVLQKQQWQQRIAELEQALREETQARHTAQQQVEVAAARSAEREAGFRQQLAQFEEQKLALTKEFELLANRIFEEKGKAFDSHSRQQIDHVLKPFRDQIDGFQKRVNEVHTESVQGNSRLEAQIRQVLDIGLKMSDEANTLVHALKGDKKAQGNWSEVQAELLLEMSGLREGREFQREASYKTEEGRDQRPDFIINLPNDKHIIVDSKISLNAYMEAVAAETEEERLVCLRKHVDSVRAHVRSLSDKNYTKLKGVNSPEYVFMFMGNEPAYLAAAETDPALFNEAYRKGIAIVTPNTLLSSLRIVAHLWSIDKQNKNTRELAEQASKVYDKLRIFAEKMQRLGNQLQTVQKTYEDGWNTLKDGRGSLARQVDKFVEMGVAVKERLPAALAEDQEPDEDAET